MDTGAWRALLTEFGIGIPAGIEQNENRADLVLIRNLKKYLHAFAESCRILLPKKVVKKNAHGIQADRLGPAELQVNAFRIERVRLPHFEFVDGRRGNVIAAHKPGLFGVPVRGLFSLHLGKCWGDCPCAPLRQTSPSARTA